MRITAELIQKSPQFFNPLVRALCRAGASSFIANRVQFVPPLQFDGT
jgi:hypothetical protein